jgi:hypothetical protein
MDQLVPMRRPVSALEAVVSALEEAVVAWLELVVEEIWPIAALESIVEEIGPAVGMQPCLVINRYRRRVPQHYDHVVNG